MKTLIKHKAGTLSSFSGKATMLAVVVVLNLVAIDVSAQTDTLKKQYQKEFDEFKQSVQQEFDQFRSRNDSIFYQFLKESWTEFKLMQDVKKSIPKPQNQPVMEEGTREPVQIEQLEPKTMLQDTGKQIKYQLGPRTYESVEPSKPCLTIDFYGSRVDVFKTNVPEFNRGEISKFSIANFFEQASKNDDLTYSIFDLVNKAKYKKLNGWGYIRLLQEASSVKAKTLNEQVLFTWTALLKTGYDARIGFDKKDVYLFVNFDEPVFYKLYLVKNGQKYYLVPFKGQAKPSESIVSYQADFPGDLNRPSLILKEIPAFGQKKKSRKVEYFNETVNLSFNNYLVEFYKTYPDCELALYFPPPLSEVALSALDNFFQPKMSNLNDEERVNLLLSFIQHGIAYESDDKQFGYENYLFAEESLFYPSVDCEDRTVLLSQLVKHYTGLQSIALAYPGHVSLAVAFPETVNGSYVMYQGQKYYVCDPTYIGAKSGMMMPEFEKEKPEVIVY